MKKIFFLLFLWLPSHIFACALCALYTPSATIEVRILGTPTYVESMEFKWNFSAEFVKTLLDSYDKNNNKILDEKELKKIEKILIEYIEKKNYLTAIEYVSIKNVEADVQKLPIKIEKKKLSLDGNALSFYFKTRIDKEIEKGDEFSFVTDDDEGFFKFLVHSVSHDIAEPFSLEFNVFNHIAFAKITNGSPTLIANQLPPKEGNLTTAPKESSLQTSWLAANLKKLQDMMQEQMRMIKENGEFLAYSLFLGASFLYGLLHAAGPGHGKTLVSSYLLASKHRYSKALFMALSIGIVHTFSAFLLTLVIYFAFEIFFNAFFTNVAYYATKISALIIMGIVFYLAIKKYKATRQKTPNIVSFSAHPFTCGCSGCSSKSQSTDWGVVLGAGIVPCPGTVTIFIFALNTKAYMVGFLSAIFMSLGMSVIIAISAFATLFAKNKFLTKKPKIAIYSEFISLGIMFVLGLILLVA